MAYTFSVNNTPATGAVAIYLVVSTMVSAGWTVVGSGDGTTYANGSAGPVVSGASGVTGLGNNSAWIRVRAPATNGGSVVNQTREWLFQRGTSDINWRFKYSASAGFSGGSPSATIVPTATDQLVVLGAGTDASPTPTVSWFAANGGYRWHIACGGAAEFYSFYAFSITTGTASQAGSVGFLMDVLATGTYPATDPDPAVVYCSNTTGSGTPFGEASYFAVSTVNALTNVTNPCKARAWMGATSQADIATTGTNSQGITIACFGTLMGGANTLGTNPFTGKDDLLACWWMRSGGSTAPIGLKGCSTLIMQGSVIRTTMDTADVAGTKDKVFFGPSPIWLPWSGATPTI